MSIKEDVRRCITDLTKAAYERGYSDGAQSALTEIESIAGEDVVGQLEKAPVARKAAKAKANGRKSKTRQARAATARPGPKAKQTTNGKERSRSKSAIVREALQALLAKKGEARRDEVLAAAQAANPAITKYDLANGLRAMAKQSTFRVSPEDGGLLLPV